MFQCNWPRLTSLQSFATMCLKSLFIFLIISKYKKCGIQTRRMSEVWFCFLRSLRWISGQRTVSRYAIYLMQSSEAESKAKRGVWAVLWNRRNRNFLPYGTGTVASKKVWTGTVINYGSVVDFIPSSGTLDMASKTYDGTYIRSDAESDSVLITNPLLFESIRSILVLKTSIFVLILISSHEDMCSFRRSHAG